MIENVSMPKNRFRMIKISQFEDAKSGHKSDTHGTWTNNREPPLLALVCLELAENKLLVIIQGSAINRSAPPNRIFRDML